MLMYDTRSCVGNYTCPKQNGITFLLTYEEKKGCDPQRTSFILMYDTCSCVGNYTCPKQSSITYYSPMWRSRYVIHRVPALF